MRTGEDLRERRIFPLFPQVFGAAAARSLYGTPLIFVLLASGILIIGYFYHRHFEREYKRETENVLASISELKVNELREWRKERLGGAAQFYGNTTFSRLVDRSLHAPEDVDSRQGILSWFRQVCETDQFDRLSLFDAAMAERLSYPKGPELSDTLFLRHAAMALLSREIVFQDFYRDQHNHRVYLNILVPVLDTRNSRRVIGMVAMRMDPERYIYPLLKRWPIPNRTAETLLIRKEGNSALFLNALKFNEDAALKLRIPLDSTDVPAVKAALGQEGTVEGRDYRGVPVMANVRAVGNSPWFLVARMDLAEVYGPLNERLWITVFLMSALLLGAGLGMALVWRRQKSRLYRDQYQSARESAWLHDVIARSLNEIYVIDPGTLRLTLANKGAQRNIGYSTQELTGLTAIDIKPEYTEESFRATVQPLLVGTDKVLVFETVHQRKDGTRYPVESHLQLVERPEGAVLLEIVNDITERKQAEVQVKRLNRVYAVLSDINEAIVRIHDPEQLSEEACRIAVDVGQFKMAWIGKVNPETRKIEIAASRGATDDYLDNLALNLHESQQRSGPTGTAILKGMHTVTNDIEHDADTLPLRERALRLGFRSAATFPLKVSGETRGALCLYATEVGFFDEHELRLLDDLAMDISFAFEFIQKESERRRVQEALSTSELRFRQLFDDAPIGYHEIDVHGAIVMVNRTELELLGYRPEEMLGHPVWEFIVDSESSRRAVAAKISGSMQSGGTYERTFRKKDETTLSVLVKDRPLLNEAGEVLGIRSTVQDITERKKADEELRLMAQSVASAQDCISITDLENRFIFVNDAFRDAYGYTTEELLGKDIAILRSPRMLEGTTADILQGTHGGRWHGEIVNRRKDGSEFPVELWTSVVKDEKGTPVALVGAARDITDRKAAEELLRQSEEQFRLIAENLGDMIAVVDLDGKRIYNSPSYKSVLGDPEALKLTDGFLEIHPDDREKVRQVFQETVRTGIGQRLEYRFLLKDGSVRTIDSKGSVVRDSDGKIFRVIVVSRDVTEEKRLAAQFLRSQRMESIGTLAGGIAHDLNNVLSPVMMAIEVLRTKMSDEVGRRILTTIETSAKRGADIVRQVLAFGRGVKGDRILVQLKHIVTEVVKIAGGTLPKAIRIKTDMPRDLWTVSADPTQMHQVLLNMLVNARDAMPGGGTLAISAENIKLDDTYSRMHLEAKPGAYVCIVITDTGTGIPAEIREKIFEPFFTTKEIGMGTGLGLSTTLAIVRSHGGFINVDSEMGKGTTFKIYIPATGTVSGETEAIAEVALPGGTGELVLVIDDEAAIREITRETLEAYGYKAMTASDGAEGVALFAEHKKNIALVITDIMMPVMDGTAAILALKRIQPEVKIIAVSGFTTREQMTASSSSSVQAFLTKPYTAEELLKALAAALK